MIAHWIAPSTPSVFIPKPSPRIVYSDCSLNSSFYTECCYPQANSSYTIVWQSDHSSSLQVQWFSSREFPWAIHHGCVNEYTEPVQLFLWSEHDAGNRIRPVGLRPEHFECPKAIHHCMFSWGREMNGLGWYSSHLLLSYQWPVYSWVWVLLQYPLEWNK